MNHPDGPRADPPTGLPTGLRDIDAAARPAREDPITRFVAWLAEAEGAGGDKTADANAMTLATADAAGRPSARMVLLKAVDASGFVFYTNLDSRKGRQLAENPYCALCFHWAALRRSVRVEGVAAPVSDAEADAYFASREYSSRIGAWASRQSRPLASRGELERRVARCAARRALSGAPRPPFWSGFRVRPERIEFWRNRPFRLHERELFTRAGDAGGDDWVTQKLYP